MKSACKLSKTLPQNFKRGAGLDVHLSTRALSDVHKALNSIPVLGKWINGKKAGTEKKRQKGRVKAGQSEKASWTCSLSGCFTLTQGLLSTATLLLQLLAERMIQSIV